MSHVWRIVKNSRLGGHRPLAEFKAELSDALREFELREGQTFALHDSIRDSLGLSSGEQVLNIDSLFANPFPFMHSHGRYLCGLVSTPTNAEDGIAEFTSLFILATRGQLLTVILDPETTYAGPFGQRLLNRQDDHRRQDSNDVGTSLLMIIRDNVTSLNFVLRELTLEVEHLNEVLQLFGQDRKRDDFESLKRIESHLGRMRIEIESLLSVTSATAELVLAIADNRVEIEGVDQIFERHHEITAGMLAIQAKQTVAVRDRLEGKVSALASRCETLRDKFFVEATHRFGAVATLLLVPSFIVGFYGQNVDFPEQHWISGWAFSVTLIVLTTLTLIAYFRKRHWL